MLVRSSFNVIFIIVLVTNGLAVAEAEESDAYQWILAHPDPDVRSAAEQWQMQIERQNWTDVTGEYSIEADYVSHTQTTVTLRNGEKEVNVPIKKLSPMSQQWLKDIENARTKIDHALELTVAYRRLMRERGVKPKLKETDYYAVEQPEPKSREEALAVVAEERKTTLSDYQRVLEKTKREEANVARRILQLGKSRHGSSKVVETLTDLKTRQETLKEELSVLAKRMRKIDLIYKQCSRRVIESNRQDGDPEYQIVTTTLGETLLTKEEVEQMQMAKEAAERENIRKQEEGGSSRIAADHYLKTLISQGDIDQATFRGTSFGGAKIHYQITYTSPAGLVLTRNAAVMTLKDKDDFWYVPMLVSVYGRISSDGLLWGQ